MSLLRLIRVPLLHGAFLLFLLAFVFPGAFLRGEMIAPADLLFTTRPWSEHAPKDFSRVQNPLMSDVITAFFPYYALTEQALEEGAWPLWNPLEFAGMPLLANCQTAIFYPPRLLHSIFELRLATTLYIVLKLWLCGMAAFFCARGLRFSGGLSSFVSVAWMLASYNQIWANWSLPDVSVWLPILFFGVEWILEGHYRKGFWAMAAGGTLILLAGHPETAFGMALGLGVYFAARLLLLLREGGRVWPPVAAAAGAWALAIAVCMMQLLPFIEYLLNSATFFDRPEEQQNTFLPLHALAAFWAPRFFGASADDNFWGDINSNIYSMIYPGVAVWIGVWLLAARGRLEPLRRAQAVALWVASIIGVLLAFSLPPFHLVHALPVFGSMIRAYHIAFTVFALPLLAAIGIEHWQSRPRRAWEAAALLPGLLVAVAVLWFNYDFSRSLMNALKVTGYVQEQLAAAVDFTVLAAAAVLMLRGARASRLLPAAMTVLLAADLLYLNRDMSPTFPRSEVYPETELTNYLQKLDPPARVAIGEGYIPSGLFAVYGIEEWLAYDGLYPRRMHHFQTTLGPEVWKSMEPVCAKAFYLHRPDYPVQFPLEEAGRFEKIAEQDGIEVYRNLKAFPRAFLVGSVEVENDLDKLYARMKSAEYRPGEVVLAPPSPALENIPQALREVSPAETIGSAKVISHASTRVVVEAKTQRPSVLVLADALYPGWQAKVDGKPVDMFPAYDVFRGLLLEAGEHTITYEYRPASFYAGLAISVSTLLGTLIWLAGFGRTRPRPAMGFKQESQ